MQLRSNGNDLVETLPYGRVIVFVSSWKFLRDGMYSNGRGMNAAWFHYGLHLFEGGQIMKRLNLSAIICSFLVGLSLVVSSVIHEKDNSFFYV